MADWRNLIWRGSGRQGWSPESRLLAAYLLSGPSTNRIGCFPFSLAAAADQTGLSPERITSIIAEFGADGFVRFDLATGWIWIPDILRVHGFTDTNEVRLALPELALAPKTAFFRAELVQLFRSSADRPGVPPKAGPHWLSGLLGEDQAGDLAERMSMLNARIKKDLPGLPMYEPAKLRPLARIVIHMLDYIRRCRGFFVDLVNVRAMRILGLIAIICAILFIVFPGIDLGVAGWFYEPPRNFTIGASWIGRFFDTDIHFGMEWFLAVILGVFLYGWFKKKWLWGFTPKKFLVVALSIALAAGLMTNVVFKDSWGRARPSQIVEFGGSKQFSPPFMRSDQCQKNCSFVSGDASLAASFMAFAVVADRHRRRWWLGLGSFTVLVGFMRMARGSHFLSDVVFAVVFTLMIVLTVSRLIMEDRWRTWPRWRENTSGSSRA